jgi:transglutaminase-like putative cysteine protease
LSRGKDDKIYISVDFSHYRSTRLMKKTWLKLFCGTMVMIVLLTGILGCPGPNTKTPAVANNMRPDADKISIVTPQRVAPTAFDLSGAKAEVSATPDAGGTITTNGMTLAVPKNAVAAEIPVQVTTVAQPPPVPPFEFGKQTGLEPAVSVGPVFDLGPDGISFNKPVTVTLPYDPALISSPEYEPNVQIVYYNGVNWVAAGGKIDTAVHTVTAQFTAFPGIAVTTALAFTAMVTGVSMFAYRAYGTYYVKDPIAWKNANDYITPKTYDDGSTVADYARRAIVGKVKNAAGTGFDYIYLQDPQNPGKLNPEAKDWLLNHQSEVRIGFDTRDKGDKLPAYPNYAATSGATIDYWVTPEDYFKNNMSADCKNISNAYLTIMRSVGIEGRCADGYIPAGRHVWVEMKIDGIPLVLDIDGSVTPYDTAVKNEQFRHTKGIKDEGYMWDENGQKDYKESWWLTELTVSSDESKAYPGGEVTVNVLGSPGLALGIKVSIENPAGEYSNYSGTADTATGIYSFKVPIKSTSAPGEYRVSADSIEKGISGIGTFTVVTPQMSLDMLTSQFAAGDTMIVNVRIMPAVETAIEIDGYDGRWMTDTDGFAFPALPIAKDAKAGNYSLKVKCPLFNIFTNINYTVTLPPGIRVDIVPEEVAPGDIFMVNIVLQPPAATYFTIRGLDGRWTTDADGFGFATLKAGTTPGDYQIIVDVPSLGLAGSNIYTISTASVPQINTDITCLAADLAINAEGSNEDEDWGVQLIIGGQYIRGSLNGTEVHASGRVQTNTGEGDIYYDFYLSKDFSTVISGSVSLIADTGETFYFEIHNLPRNPEMEAKYKQENGLEGLIYGVTGTDVGNYYSGVRADMGSLGTISRYYLDANSELFIVLLAANESQISALMEQ